MTYSPEAPKTSAPGRTTLVTFLVLLGVAFVITTRMVLPYLLAVVTGGILAMLSYTLFKKLEHRTHRPKLSATVVTLGILLLVIIPLGLFLTVAVRQAIALGQTLASNENLSFQSLVDRVGQWGPVQTLIGSPENFDKQARAGIQTAGKLLSAGLVGIAANLPALFLQLALGFLSCFFLLLDGKRFLSWTRDRLPLDSEVRSRVATTFSSTAVSTIWATLAAAAAQAVLMFASFLILDVPVAFLAAGATFIFAWIPILGSAPVWIAGAMYLYIQGAMSKVVIMAILGIITGVVDNFVRPMVLKGKSEMHPLVSLVAIFGGLGMFGILGIFMGPILAAVLITLLEVWPHVGQRYGLLRSERIR
ncbi:MAG: AI-2E family transporter [Methylotenera sp.]|nr:AI-2E family transporter [Oligoflexia bacterium]